ncbi:MAG: epoxyqueuosine reductase [Eubacterium sp.]|nr:epoxyqueuosine reductase [Eubacterium sp.]
MLTKEEFIAKAHDIFAGCSRNRVSVPGSGELMLFDQPLIGFASAIDPIFDQYMSPEIIGSMFKPPREWLPEGRTVVSFFLPHTREVRISNREEKDYPSMPWLYGRYEGQNFIGHYMKTLSRVLEEEGIKTCVPWMDDRFEKEPMPVSGDDGDDFHMNSSWSERHVAYACGLGTFGLSRGLITEAGMAGRLTSMILSVEYKPDIRPYTEVYEYCIGCGACARRCPAQAISLNYGKNNVKCNAFLDRVKEQEAPRYGCGKCQIGVPCEYRRP